MARYLAAAALAFGAVALPPPPVLAADSPLWLRYAALTPDGETILFSYQGDVYAVPAAGGTRTPFYKVLGLVLVAGLGLALCSVGFGGVTAFGGLV